MKYEEKIEQARSLVDRHNAGVPEGTQKVDFEAFLAKLITEGGTTDEGLKACSWEDLQSFGLPKLLARNVAEMFRGKAAQEGRKTVITPARAQGMAVKDLLEAYDPREAENAAGQRLNELANGKHCIVFNADGTVNAEVSERLISEYRDGLPDRAIMTVGDRPQKTYRIGERPNQLADENPLYPGRPLRSGGYCDQTNRSWNDVSATIRLLIYLAVTRTREIVVNQIGDAHNVLDLAVLAEGAEARIRSRYAKASVLYDQLAEQGNLPSLKIELSGSGAGSASGANDPFNRGTGNKTF